MYKGAFSCAPQSKNNIAESNNMIRRARDYSLQSPAPKLSVSRIGNFSNLKLIKMLTLLVFLLVTHQVAGQLQCPQVAASFGDNLDLSSFYLQLGDGLSDTRGETDAGSASGGGSCEFL